jgi:hypothetical protein
MKKKIDIIKDFFENELNQLMLREALLLIVIKKTHIVTEEKKAKIDLISIQAKLELVKQALLIINKTM